MVFGNIDIAIVEHVLKHFSPILPAPNLFFRFSCFLFCVVSELPCSDVGFVDFRDTESAAIAKERFKGHDLRGHAIGAH